MKKRSKAEREKELPDGECPNHVEHDMGYVEFFEYGSRMVKKGLEQIQCPKCGLYIWPEFWKGNNDLPTGGGEGEVMSDYYQVKCMLCGKEVTTPIPKTTVVRAIIICPECFDFLPPEAVAEAVAKLERDAKATRSSAGGEEER